MRRIKFERILGISLVNLIFVTTLGFAEQPQLGSSRVVFQTNYGDIEFGFYPTVAPKTVAHIFKLVRLGCYNTNHFFRVDKGFVAQVADVVGGRTASLNAEQRIEAEKTVVGEFSEVKHVRGILSMGRYDDPDSAGSSFSMLLGNAPHLDGKYAIFGKVTKGDETLRKLEELPTRKEGIFVMPMERITILSSYYYGKVLVNSDPEYVASRGISVAVFVIRTHEVSKLKQRGFRPPPFIAVTTDHICNCARYEWRNMRRREINIKKTSCSIIR